MGFRTRLLLIFEWRLCALEVESAGGAFFVKRME